MVKTLAAMENSLKNPEQPECSRSESQEKGCQKQLGLD
jgi:hypothetical protein